MTHLVTSSEKTIADHEVVTKGGAVKKGEAFVELEAMKMVMPLKALKVFCFFDLWILYDHCTIQYPIIILTYINNY